MTYTYTRHTYIHIHTYIYIYTQYTHICIYYIPFVLFFLENPTYTWFNKYSCILPPRDFEVNHVSHRG